MQVVWLKDSWETQRLQMTEVDSPTLALFLLPKHAVNASNCLVAPAWPAQLDSQ